MKSFYVACVFLLYSCNALEISPKASRSKKTIGVYSHRSEVFMGRQTTRLSIYKYTVNHKAYHTVPVLYSATAGDGLAIIYDTTNPKRHKVLYEEPLFKPNEVTRRTFGKIEFIEKNIFDLNRFRILRFTIEGQQDWFGFQYIRTRTLRHHPEIKPGAYFELEYPGRNLDLTILHIDRFIPSDSIQSKIQYYKSLNHKLDSLTLIEKRRK
jgi:hypothetical protein